MAADKLPTFRQRSIPQFGVIEGGLLDGWSFGLDSLHVHGRRVFLDVRATPPNWPFPRLVRMTSKDFTKLRNPGERAKNHDTATLIKAAIEAGKYQ